MHFDILNFYFIKGKILKYLTSLLLFTAVSFNLNAHGDGSTHLHFDSALGFIIALASLIVLYISSQLISSKEK